MELQAGGVPSLGARSATFSRYPGSKARASTSAGRQACGGEPIGAIIPRVVRGARACALSIVVALAACATKRSPPPAGVIADAGEAPTAAEGGVHGSDAGTLFDGGGDAGGDAGADAGRDRPLAKGDPCRGAPLPAGAHYVPPGFCARHVAGGMRNARQLAFTPSGDLFVTNYWGEIFFLHDADGDGVWSPAETHFWATTEGVGATNSHLDVSGGYLYTGSPLGVRRFAWSEGLLAAGPGEDVVVGQPTDGGHRLHTTHVYDGYLYVQSGSSANIDDPTAPAYDTNRSLIKRFDLSKLVPGSPFAWSAGEPFTVGLRNTVGFTRNETTKKMYGVVNGIDFMFYGGAQVDRDNPGEQLVELELGAAYGYPFCFTAQHLFTNGTTGALIPAGTQVKSVYSTRDDAWCAANSRKPATFFQAHSAPLDLVFFDEQPRGALPEKYRGGAFVALHGSSHRATTTGHQVVWVPFHPDGTSVMPTATESGTTFPFEVVLGGGTEAGPVDGTWGIEQDGGESPMRPAGVAISPIDGALYVASDAVGNVFRVGLKK